LPELKIDASIADSGRTFSRQIRVIPADLHLVEYFDQSGGRRCNLQAMLAGGSLLSKCVGALPFWLLVVGAIAVLGTPRPKFEQHR
jgi:hypothetical protein